MIVETVHPNMTHECVDLPPKQDLRTVIEFDGNTVLCRVCGDKASGFHYGVHACEGCKGFFRRSIQQKIQYRPCLKNQQCNIMRVNRNRCQYCRLKKCISVGMSRDAVRFGRVPKKEKAKIMEQMQRVNEMAQSVSLDMMMENEQDMAERICLAHRECCVFSRSKIAELFEVALRAGNYVDCPASMACPLNPNPGGGDDSKNWEHFTDCFTPAIRNVVNFAKSIPGFQMFAQEDQVTLLKAGTFEILLVHLAALFDADSNTMMFTNGNLYRRTANGMTSSAGFLLDSMFDFAARVHQLKLTEDEIALFSALVVVAEDRPGLRNPEIIEKVRKRISISLQSIMHRNHPEDPSVFSKLLLKIPDVRTLNTLHSEKLLSLTIDKGHEDSVKEEQSERPSSAPGCPYSGSEHVQPYETPSSPGAPIVGHRIPMEGPPSELVLKTPVGTFHREASPSQQWPSEQDRMQQIRQDQYPTSRLEQITSLSIPSDTSKLCSSTCSSPEPLEIDLEPIPKNNPIDTVPKQQKSESPAPVDLRSSPMTNKMEREHTENSRPSSPPLLQDKPVSHYSLPAPKAIPSFLHPNKDNFSRKRPYYDQIPAYENKLAKIQASWEYDMRSSRSNSLSSTSSHESVDSAYRSISNPGTPRSHYDLDIRSPYPTVNTPTKTVLDTAKNYATENVESEPADVDSTSNRCLSVDSARGSSYNEKPRKKSVLGLALSVPPLSHQRQWFHKSGSSIFSYPGKWSHENRIPEEPESPVSNEAISNRHSDSVRRNSFSQAPRISAPRTQTVTTLKDKILGRMEQGAPQEPKASPSSMFGYPPSVHPAFMYSQLAALQHYQALGLQMQAAQAMQSMHPTTDGQPLNLATSSPSPPDRNVKVEPL